jgi:hypothetical protein
VRLLCALAFASYRNASAVVDFVLVCAVLLPAHVAVSLPL